MAKSEEIDLVPVQKPKKSKLSLILIALLVVMTGAAGFFGWQYFSAAPKVEAKPETAPTAGKEGEEAEPPAAAEEGEHGAGGEHAEKGNQSTVLNFEPFLVNLADRDNSRYLRITIKLQVANKNAADKIASADVLTSQIRDTILSTLATKNADQITTREGKDQLKNEITEKLNGFLPGKPIKAVFFTDFVVQL
jgi:flagellar FliL protein